MNSKNITDLRGTLQPLWCSTCDVTRLGTMRNRTGSDRMDRFRAASFSLRCLLFFLLTGSNRMHRFRVTFSSRCVVFSLLTGSN